MFDKVPASVISALRGYPMLFVMFMTNLAVLAMVTYLTVQAATMRASERSELITALRNCLTSRPAP